MKKVILKTTLKMHVYYKFGLFVIFMLSISTCYTRAAPATNQSSSFEDYTGDYDDDYYDENEGTAVVDKEAAVNRLTTTTTTSKPLFPIFTQIDLPKRSNHVLEPNCPKACLCLEDYKYIQCSNSHLTHVPQDLPSTALIIDLSQNQIRELHANDFANCTKVREINLNHNQIATIDKETFMGLKRLQRLRLADNQLARLHTDVFSDASDLSSLDVSNNSLMLNSEGSFLNQPGLLELSCRNCMWTQLYDKTFANLSSLTTLKLDQNDFNKKINTKAFTPLKNLIKLKLPELDQSSVQELCNLLKSIDNISFKHFDISCYELVLGTSFNESLILATDPPFKAPPTSSKEGQERNSKDTKIKATAMSDNASSSNLTLPVDNSANILTAGIVGVGVVGSTVAPADEGEEKAYQVPISQEAINFLLISIMILAVIGLIIGVICRKDVGGIKTKCCRTRKPEPKDQVHPAEEIPLNKLA